MLRQQTDGKAARPGQWSRWAVRLAAACAVIAGASHIVAAPDDEKPVSKRGDSREAPRTDLHGDPLPPGALARLGTVRWRHGFAVAYVAFTPDGKSLLTAAQDNTIRLWDWGTGKEIRRFGKPPAVKPNAPGDPAAQLRQAVLVLRGGMAAYGAGSTGVALAPDGKTLAATTPNGTIQLWEVATGKEIRTIQAPAGSGGGLLFSPDGKLLAGRGADQSIRLWDTSTGKEVRQIRREQKNPRVGFVAVGGFYGAAGLAFAPDGKTLAAPETAFANQRVSTFVTLWETDTGKERRQIEVNPPTGVSAVAFAPDGKVLAYASGNAIHLCDPATGKQLRAIEAQAAALAFSPDSKTLAAKGLQGSEVHLCSVETGKVVREVGEKPALALAIPVFFMRTGGSAHDLAFSPDGKVVAVGGTNVVHLWDADTGKDASQVSGHRAAVTSLAVAPGGKLVASTGADSTVRLWESATGKERHRFRAPAGTTCVALAVDVRTVALGNVDSTVRLHEVATGKELRRLQGHQNGVVALAFSPDGKTVASRGMTDNTIRLYDVTTGNALRVIALQAPKIAGAPGGGFVVNVGGVGGTRIGLAFSPDGKTVASPGVAGQPGAGMAWGAGGMQGTLNLWDVATGKEVRKIVLPAQYGALSFAFAPDGRSLATENTDGTITLWELASGKERARFGKAPELGQPVANRLMVVNGFGGFGAPASPTLAFAPDGRTLAVRGADLSVQVWDVAAGKETGRLKGHEGGVTAVAFAPDGKALLSGSSDTTVLLWDATRVSAGPKTANQLRAEEVEALWADLAAADAAKAFRGIHALAAAPGQVVPFLRERLRPAAPADAEKVRQWIADLESRQFAARQRAMKSLEKLGELAVPALEKVLKAGPPLETRIRVEQLLEKLTGAVLTDDRLRLVRALEVLELVGTSEARQVLEALSRGAPGALPTREAQGALERLNRR